MTSATPKIVNSIRLFFGLISLVIVRKSNNAKKSSPTICLVSLAVRNLKSNMKMNADRNATGAPVRCRHVRYNVNGTKEKIRGYRILDAHSS